MKILLAAALMLGAANCWAQRMAVICEAGRESFILHTAPKAEAPVVAELPCPIKAWVVSTSDGWSSIEDYGSHKGYVPTAYLAAQDGIAFKEPVPVEKRAETKPAESTAPSKSECVRAPSDPKVLFCGSTSTSEFFANAAKGALEEETADARRVAEAKEADRKRAEELELKKVELEHPTPVVNVTVNPSPPTVIQGPPAPQAPPAQPRPLNCTSFTDVAGFTHTNCY